MIKPNELRLGNLLQDDNGNIMTVEELKVDGLICRVIDREKYPLPQGWHCQPIPLTEEWLLKFGFEHAYTSSYPEYTRYCINSFSVSSWGKQKLICLGDFESEYDIEIQHVHQLQNLYFALTGEELKLINPKQK